MGKIVFVSVSAIALLTMTGPGAARSSTPCARTSSQGSELICYCQPGGKNCRCIKVATDETGVETW
jgi:hypothetical protein